MHGLMNGLCKLGAAVCRHEAALQVEQQRMHDQAAANKQEHDQALQELQVEARLPTHVEWCSDALLTLLLYHHTQQGVTLECMLFLRAVIAAFWLIAHAAVTLHALQALETELAAMKAAKDSAEQAASLLRQSKQEASKADSVSHVCMAG